MKRLRDPVLIAGMIAAALLVVSAMAYAAWQHLVSPEPPAFVIGIWQPAAPPTPELRLETRFSPPAPITWRGMEVTPRKNIGLRKALGAGQR
jgi:hypothetical protein